MRIVSYNVRYFAHGLKGLASTGKTKLRIAKALASLQPRPEVICLQEVEKRSFRSSVAHRGVGGHKTETQLEAFMRHLNDTFVLDGQQMPYEAWYFPAHAYQVGAFKIYTTGLAILVHRQALDVVLHNGLAPHAITHVGVNWLRRVKQTRICAHIELQNQQGKRFHVFNTHLSLPSLTSRQFWTEAVRMGQGPNQMAEARALVAFVKERAGNAPAVVCGDFNSAPATAVYRYLCEQEQLHGAQAVLKQIDPHQPDGYCTAGFMGMRMHLDHLFSHGELKWVNLDDTARFGDTASRFHGLSDHVPLIGTFEV